MMSWNWTPWGTGNICTNLRAALCCFLPFSPGLCGVDSANFAAVFSHTVKPEISKMGIKKQEIFFRRLHITFVTFDWQLSLSMLHTASKICAFVNTLPGLAAR